MKTLENLSNVQAFDRAANALKAINKKARNIRKLLKNQKQAGQGTWGLLDDAVRLAENIEVLSSNANTLAAEDATARVELLEIFFELLDQMLAQILAS